MESVLAVNECVPVATCGPLNLDSRDRFTALESVQDSDEACPIEMASAPPLLTVV